MRKKLLVALLFLLILPLFVYFKSFAQDKDSSFEISTNSTYNVSDTGVTRVSQNVTITNKTEFTYVPSYAITLGASSISGISVTNGDGASIPFTVEDASSGTKKIQINFPDKIVGVGKKNAFTFSFTSPNFARKNGSTWDVDIPAMANPQAFDSYSVKVVVPFSFGTPSIIKPSTSFGSSGTTYTFDAKALNGSGISIIFGKTQVFRFKLTYHLENKNIYPVETEIALPLNTSSQEVIVESISEKPKNTYTDMDENFMARYVLLPKSKMTITTSVLVNVLSSPKASKLSSTDRKIYLAPQKYWEVNDPEIVKLAAELKTPEAIYDYTVKSLSYSTPKTNSQNVRLGAKGVLAKPYFAVCLEFTDLFIAIARAAGIPARAVEGYAYTNDEKDKPLSLFQDVLHAWPEYYNSEKGAWVMVDPTWGNTTRGVDYFHSNDLDHVAFVINGLDSVYPVPAGGYKASKETKDVEASFASISDFKPFENTKISSEFPKIILQGTKIDGKISISNVGNSESMSRKVTIFIDGKKSTEIDLPQTYPFGTSTVGVLLSVEPQKLSFSTLTNFTHTITITDNTTGKSQRYILRIIPIPVLVFLGGGIIIAGLFIFFIAAKTRSVPVQK